MNPGWMVSASALIGGAAGWLAASSRLGGRIRDSASRAAAAEAGQAALRERELQSEQEKSLLRERLEAEQRNRVSAEARLEAERKNLDEQRRLIEEARQELRATFKSLSAETLDAQRDSFLALAHQSFETLRAATEGDLARRQEAIDGLVNPLRLTLERYEAEVLKLEGSRQQAYGKLERFLTQLTSTERELQQETAKLVNALRKPQVRGRWGEITLRRVVELVGMVSHCDFCEQVLVDTDDGRLRPDMIVHLAGGRDIVVDAKTALDAYLNAIEAPSEELRQQALAEHARQVRRHMEQLAAKVYGRLSPAPEFVILFLPGDPFLSAAADQDPRLIEDGLRRGVLIATPVTLIALLRAIDYGWRQRRLDENAHAISELGRQLYDRLCTFVNHFGIVGVGLKRAVENYNRAVGSLQSRVLVSAQRFTELGIAGKQALECIEPIDQTPLSLADPEPRPAETLPEGLPSSE